MRYRLGLLVLTVLLIACSAPSGGSATPTATAPSSNPAVSPVPGSPVADASQVAPTEVVDVSASPIAIEDILEGAAGPRNVVQALNNTNNRFEARGHVDVNRIRGNRVEPANIANARSSCTDCQSIAVAVQISVYRRGASDVAPVNVAQALNEHCTRCVTVARAIQYVIPVDDPSDLPRRADELSRAMNREMRYFESVHDINQLDPKKAEARLQQLESQFSDLLQYVSEARDEKEDEDSPTPSPSPTVLGTATLAPSPTVSGTLTPAPSREPAVGTPSPSATQ